MLEEKKLGRRRFISSPKISPSSPSWLADVFEFKTYIRDNTQYQLADNYIYWRCVIDSDDLIPMLSVIGAPSDADPLITTIDADPESIWVYTTPLDQSLFVDIKSYIKSLSSQLLEKIPPEMGKSFHLVINDEKIELHFFLQKDYIG